MMDIESSTRPMAPIPSQSRQRTLIIIQVPQRFPLVGMADGQEEETTLVQSTSLDYEPVSRPLHNYVTSVK